MRHVKSRLGPYPRCPVWGKTDSIAAALHSSSAHECVTGLLEGLSDAFLFHVSFHFDTSWAMRGAGLEWMTRRSGDLWRPPNSRETYEDYG